jgi:LysR family transcriptional regulator, regulator for metE and metH
VKSCISLPMKSWTSLRKPKPKSEKWSEASIEMVKAEMGIFVAANWVLEPYLKSSALKKVKIGRKGLKRNHFIAVLTSRQFPDYFNQFIDFLQREIVLD